MTNPGDICPRFSPGPWEFTGLCEWEKRGACGYCGSLNPEEFMRRIEAGDCEITPTDKNYKAYIRNVGGAPFKQTYRACPFDATCTGPDDCTHYVTRDQEDTKFYYEHLDDAQRTRFIDLLNQKKMKLSYPGYFYVLPFFCGRGKQ